jgi:hypothetical protein
LLFAEDWAEAEAEAEAEEVVVEVHMEDNERVSAKGVCTTTSLRSNVRLLLASIAKLRACCKVQLPPSNERAFAMLKLFGEAE